MNCGTIMDDILINNVVELINEKRLWQTLEIVAGLPSGYVLCSSFSDDFEAVEVRTSALTILNFPLALVFRR